jgi:hypothetical protein
MRHRRALAVVIVALLVAGAAVTITWRWVGEERRLGSVVGRLLAHRTGLPFTIGAAHAGGDHVILDDVRLRSHPFDIRVRRLDITGGVVSLLASADGAVEIVATSASVTIAEGSIVPPLDVLRAHLLSLLDWPGTMRLTMLGGELENDGHRFVFDLTGEKTQEGDVVMTVSVGPVAERAALKVGARATVGRAGAVQLAVELAGEPRRLAGLWPATLPPPTTLAARGNAIVVKGGDAEASGRLTLGASTVPAVVDGTVRYDARTQVVTAPRYVLTRADGVHLEGDGALEPGRQGRRIVARAAGTIDGARVEGGVRYEISTGAFDGEASVHGGTVRSLWKRLELPGVPPEEASVATAQARFSGVDRVAGITMDVDVVAGGVRLARWPALPVDGTVKAALRVAPAVRGLTLASISGATMRVTRAGLPLAVITGASRGSALWPLSVDARVADAGRLAPWLPFQPVLAGSVRLTGLLEPAAFAGDLLADLASATVMLRAPVTLTNVRAAVPVRWQAGAASAAGSVRVERAAGFGFVAADIASPATFTDGRLVLDDVRYTHYGGRGAGTLEASTHAPVRFAARMVGDGVDLAAFVREAGVTIARATGRVDYVMSIQETAAHGLFLAGRVEGAAGGGEIAIDAIERLLASSTTDVDASGLLRRTLENLRIFRYDSLAADVRLTGATGHVDVALKGRKRLGIFPGPVDAINLHHVPLDVLARAFAKG